MILSNSVLLLYFQALLTTPAGQAGFGAPCV
jgi:hypothetical protein